MYLFSCCYCLLLWRINVFIKVRFNAYTCTSAVSFGSYTECLKNKSVSAKSRSRVAIDCITPKRNNACKRIKQYKSHKKNFASGRATRSICTAMQCAEDNCNPLKLFAIFSAIARNFYTLFACPFVIYRLYEMW